MPREDIWIIFMATVKDVYVKMRLASFCCVNVIKYSMRRVVHIMPA